TWTGTNGQTGVYTKGATTITLGSIANLSVGKILILDQDNDAQDTHEVFVCDNTVGDASHTLCSSDPTFGSPGRNINGIDRNQQEYKVVTAIGSGNQVTISPPLYMPNWRTSQMPGVWWANSV